MKNRDHKSIIASYLVFASVICAIILASSILNPWPTQDSSGVGQPDSSVSDRGDAQELPPITNKMAFYGAGYVEVPASKSLDQQTFTIAFWVKRFGPSGTYEHIISRYSDTKSGWAFDTGDTTRVGDDKIRFIVHDEDGKESSTSAATLFLQDWIHVTGTFDGSRLKLYLDGSLVGQSTFRGKYDPELAVPLRFGSAASFVGNFWTGDLADVQMFDRPLSEAEIMAVRDGTMKPDGMVGHWNLDVGRDNIVIDISGHGNSGMLYGPS